MKYHPDQNQDSKGVLLDPCVSFDTEFSSRFLLMFWAILCANVYLFHLRCLIFVAEAAEAKFKEVMASYEAIKSERKNANRCWSRSTDS